MLGMAKAPKKPPPDPKRERTGINLNVWIPAELMEAFEAARKKSRRTKTAEVMEIFEEYLGKHGFWPPPEEDQ